MTRPTITQDMISAYDEYTHLTLDRRGFMEKLTKLAGSGAAAAAIAPMLAASNAAAQQVPEDDNRLVAEDITYPGGNGEMQGYLVRMRDAANPMPSVIVIHENRGLNPHIRDVARRLALQGFLVLAPDFLSPDGGTPEDEDRAREMIGALDAAETIANATATVAFLEAHENSNGTVGAVGFCWGGGMVNDLAAASEDLVAGVAYYGRQAAVDQVPNIRAALMLHYAGLDDRVNAGIEAYEAALKEHGVEYQLFMYQGSNHAFNNDTSSARFDPVAAAVAWERTLDFFREKLATPA
ncbi:dienelactone hydrolase family protein [Georhizobium profundi]|uniref:Dienelactone hydrolase family protein n=1 Tax=Georhizobium profundi TaxID=2341112 RepID=A0A3Q8XMZ1_9HYPH|nr:dienelactone hydrolase family protein [Georhizobium profundi]AZN71298.1 dienelactone hydrolase family protein [Georhizobium profundi]